MTKPLANLGRYARAVIPTALTVCLLGASLVEKVLFHLPPADAAPYHARVSAAAKTLPRNAGPWLGTDVELPASAIKMLRPNTHIARQYQHVATGRTATLVIVQCEDARDLIGHYPPVCYRSVGWETVAEVATERTAGGEAFPVTDYAFSAKHNGGVNDIRIDNFMILPDGQLCRDMIGVEKLAQDYRRKFFGAAQVQILTHSGWSDAEREELFEQLIGRIAAPLVREIRNGAVAR